MTGNVKSCSNHKNKRNCLEKIDLVTFEAPQFAKIIYLLESPSLSLLDAEQKYILIDALGNKHNGNFEGFLIKVASISFLKSCAIMDAGHLWRTLIKNNMGIKM